ncbi:MAG: hypothetical protein HFG22_13755 [Lachnospiraceae bacterium]|nr:hypothetical protein [Lachnospiraceae bacterium]
MEQIQEALLMQEKLAAAERVLIGIGGKWKIQGRLSDVENQAVQEAYGRLCQMVEGKDYFIVTTLTDGALYDTAFEKERFVAPCGNIHWKQCAKTCTKDIWEEGEVPDGICPHCGAPLIGNTIEAETYIEEGYLPMWKKYQLWLTTTLNRELVVLELGEGFRTPTVIRWPFEKTVFFNQKAWMFRIDDDLCQVPQEIRERATSIKADPVAWIRAYGSSGSL